MRQYEADDIQGVMITGHDSDDTVHKIMDT